MEFQPSQLIFQCVWVFFLIFQCQRCIGCVDEERTALLEIKASVWYNDFLSTWVENRPSNYCAWKYVQCSETTGCVSHLDLAGVFYIGRNNGHPLLNGSLFHSFKDLQDLDLSNNGFVGWENNQGIEMLSNLKKLQFLNLGENIFNSNVLEPLSELTSLKSLYLDYNDIGVGSLSETSKGIEKLSKLKKLQLLSLALNNFNSNVVEPLSELTSLETLHLDGNRIGAGSYSEISKGLKKLSKLKRLKHLNLGSNNLKSSIFASLSELTSLQTLILDYNQLGRGSSIEFYQGIKKMSKLKRLEFLDLAYNRLKSNILASFSELTSLHTLYLDENLLGRGSLIELYQGFRNMSKLKRLEFLDLASNSLNSGVLASLSELTQLQTLRLDGNHFGRGSSIDFYRGFCELKRLRTILFTANELKGKIPPCLQNFTRLRVLDLSNNQLSGNIPPSLTSNMSSLTKLDLFENQLTGSIPPSLLFNLTSFRLLDLSYNKLTGNIPQGLTSKITSLILLDFSNNQLSGSIPPLLIFNMTSLYGLSFGNNHLDATTLMTSSLPQKSPLRFLGLGNCNLNISTNVLLKYLHLQRYLTFIDLSHNNIYGRFPAWLLENNTWLSYFLLRNNSISGRIQFRVHTANLTWPYIYVFDVSHNNISGGIPTSIANSASMTTLVMGDNSFNGPIPFEFCNIRYLEFLELSYNDFSGSIPSCLYLPLLKYLHLQENKLSGPIPAALRRSPYLVVLDLNGNNFSGGIPGWLGSLQGLRLLLLKGNRLSGFLPSDLCKLNKIGILDLSYNGFSGAIPPCFSNITFGNTEDIELHTEDPIAKIQLPYYWGVHPSYEDYTHLSVNDDLFPYNTDKLGSDVEIYYFFPFNIESFERQVVDFVVKSMSRSYEGVALKDIGGLDLSCNGFTGEIPPELGTLIGIRAMNLSYNQFTGSIPTTFLKLKQLESIDLSHNRLSGKIPSELIDINTLEVFLVAYNNLSGPLPDMKAQFATFTETSYEGNPFLCGPPLQKKCYSIASTSSVPVPVAGLSDFGVDAVSFLASCGSAYIISFLALVIVLYINPYWRKLWFDFIDACLSFMFPFWSEAFYRVSNPFT